jgi:hypothetical protein
MPETRMDMPDFAQASKPNRHRRDQIAIAGSRIGFGNTHYRYMRRAVIPAGP